MRYRPIVDDEFEPIITEEQGGRLIEALNTWSRIYFEEKGEYPSWDYVSITKSCLLGRLIYEGKQPLPVPPPRFMSAPWYELIENGRSHFWRRHGVWTDSIGVVIGQDAGWTLLETRPDGSMVVEYPRNGRWLLRAVGPDDPPVEGGHTIEGDNGERLNHARPIYFDTILERIE